MTLPAWAALAADYRDPPDDDGSDRELALRCSRDLRVFIREAWPILEPARPFVGNWHIDCVAEHLMAVSAGEMPRLLINQPPNTTKSVTTAVCWSAWEWIDSPHLRWMFASYAEKFALRDSRKQRDLIASRGGKPDGRLFQRRGYQGLLALLGKSWQLSSDQNAKGRYDTTAGGMRLATAIRGQATGDHADRIVVDDPLNPEQAYSQVDRERVNRWWDGTMKSRFIDDKATAVIVAQRLHENDLPGYLLAQDAGWHHLCLPAEYIPSHQFTYPAKVRLASGREIDGDPRTEPGELLDPVRLSEAALAEHRGNSFVFAGQFQQQPAPEGGGMFKRDWFEPRWQPGFDRYLELGFDRVIQSWDMAFKDTKGSDFVVGQVWGFHGADCYLLAQVRGRFEFSVTLHVFRALTAFEPRAIAKLVEDKANGPAVISALRHEIRGIIPYTPKDSKPARARAVTPLFEARNVVLPAADTIPCPEFYMDERGRRHEIPPTTVSDYIHELAVFDSGANDDQVDATSQALEWANPMPRAPEPDEPRQGVAETPMSGILGVKW
jgi:predicted phage terminase large subunit-like protein